MSLAVLVLLAKGVNSESQGGIFNSFVQHYIEETAASVTQPSRNNFEDINSLSAIIGGSVGRDSYIINTIQDNSVLSYASVVETIGADFTEHGVEISQYTVQEGDTLSFIASDFGVSVNTIIWANNLANINAIKPGMELKIPPVTGVLHKVKGGDTISSIAKKYAVEQEEIVSFNKISSGVDLKIGEEIVVPGGKVVNISPANVAKNSATLQRFTNLPNLAGFFGLPTTGYNWGRIHGRNGVDIANSCGTNIAASAEGIVTQALSSGWNGGFGNYIKIFHPTNGTETLYAHNSKILVSTGDKVSRGTIIALMGSTGRSTGCHLHFEVHGAKNPLAK